MRGKKTKKPKRSKKKKNGRIKKVLELANEKSGEAWARGKEGRKGGRMLRMRETGRGTSHLSDQLLFCRYGRRKKRHKQRKEEEVRADKHLVGRASG